MKKVAIIIASKDFRDEEYFIPKQILEDNKITVKTVSDKPKALGRFGGEAEADILIDNLDIDSFDAIIFVGGQGAVELLDNQTSYDLIKGAVESDKIIGAICIAPTILANAGTLKGKKATVWSSGMDKSAIDIIRLNGGSYEKKAVVIDGNIVTGENAESAEEFGNAIVQMLTKDSI